MTILNWQVTNCVSSLSVGTTQTQRDLHFFFFCMFLLRRKSSLRFSPSVRRRFDSLLVLLWIHHMFLAVRSCICVRDPTVMILFIRRTTTISSFSCGSSTDQWFINVDVFGFKYLSIHVFTSLRFLFSSLYDVIYN